VIVVVVLAACKSTPEVEKPAGVEERTPTPPAATPSGPAAQPVPSMGAEGDPLKDPKSVLSKRSVYFDFDSDAIKPEFVPVVEAHAKYLREHRSAKMLIQGNADERGTREYNIGLGQRRADALRKRLVLLGATDSQIESVSLGEEKPVCSEHDEQCWWKNRRDDMLYAGRGEY
jgi:peptidoglycan-associated lipoprotein